MAENKSTLGPYFSKLPTELILEVAVLVSSSSQKNYAALITTCRTLYDLCRLTCLPEVPIVLNYASPAARFAEFLQSDDSIAPRVHRLWIAKDTHNIIPRCFNLVSLACDGHDLIPLCCGESEESFVHRSHHHPLNPSPSVADKEDQTIAPPTFTFRHTQIVDLTIMGLWDFWSGFTTARFAPTLCGQLRRLWLLDHLFLYPMNLGWLSSLRHLAYWSIELMDQASFKNERALLQALPELVELQVMIRSPSAGVVRQAEGVSRLRIISWVKDRLEVEAWVLSQQSGY